MIDIYVFFNGYIRELILFPMYKILFSTILAITASTCIAGPDSLLKKLLRYDSVICIQGVDTLGYPWMGAFNTPQFSNIDINGDYFDDLFVFDRDGGEVRIFLHSGDSGEAKYRHAPEYEAAFPRMNDWALLRDYNKDGKPDIFTSRENSLGDMRVFRNVSTGINPEDIKFEPYLFRDPYDSTKRAEWLTYKYFTGGNLFFTNVYTLSSDIPGFADVDRDGDLDIFGFGNSTGSIIWYRNVSMDNFGGYDSLDFRISYQCWGGFREDANSFKLHLSQCLGQAPILNPGDIAQRGASRHEGSTILMHDFDCNNRTDIMLGDISFDYMVVGYNKGSLALDEILDQDTSFPIYDTPISVQTFPGAYIADVNRDFKQDLIIAPNSESYFANYNQIHYYRSETDGRCNKFQFVQDDFLQNQTLEFGSQAHPVFFDLDGDTLIDILVGNYGYMSGGYSFTAGIAYLKNVGISTHPVYKLITRDLLTPHAAGDTGLVPAIGDLDGDDIPDLLLGTASGRLYFYKNTAASVSDSAVFVYQSLPFDTISFGLDIRPALFDFNEDGLLDIIAGWQGPDLLYIPNSGTTTAPDFNYTDLRSSFGNVFHSNNIGEGYLSPFIIKQDSTGRINGLDTLPHKTYLYVGTADGYIHLYDDVINTSHPTFNHVDALFLYGRNISVSGADITGDGKMDMVYGHRTGGLGMLLKDRGNIIRQPPQKPKDTTSVAENPMSANSFALFPNPAGAEIELLWKDFTPKSAITYSIYNLEGIKVMDFSTDLPHFRLNIQMLPKGLYLIRTENQPNALPMRFVKF
jgi:hypothetical protein